MDQVEHLFMGGRVFTRPAGQFQDQESGRVIQFGDALAIEFRGKRAVIEVDALPSILDILENDTALRSALKL